MAMEEQCTNSAEIDDAAISSIKIGLMGPLTGDGVAYGYRKWIDIVSDMGVGFL